MITKEQVTPYLVLCAHGTTDPVGRRTVDSIARRLRTRRPELRVELGYVDVQEPRIGDVVKHVTASRRRPAVVVPLLLSSGYHVAVDVARAVSGNPYAVSTGPLGPDPVLSCVVVDRLIAAGACDGDAVVLAFSGSSEPLARADADTVADAVRHHWAGDVAVAFGRGSAGPSAGEAVASMRERGSRRVVIAPYLIAEGHFYDQLSTAGADLVTRTLGCDYKVISVVEQRFECGVARLQRRGALGMSPSGEPSLASRAVASLAWRPQWPPIGQGIEGVTGSLGGPGLATA